MRPPLLSLLAVVAVAACAEHRPSAPEGAPSMATAAQQGEYVPTPAGLYHRSCVHPLPDSARIDMRTGVITLKDGSTYQAPLCNYPHYSSRSSAERSVSNTPGTNFWVEFAFDTLASSNWYKLLRARWTVPAAPVGSYCDSCAYYTFAGLTNGFGSRYKILQPVLSYGYVKWGGGQFGGQFWTAEPWVCDMSYPGLGCYPHTPPLRVYPGDSIYGDVSEGNCSNGYCDWAIRIRDDTQAHWGQSFFFVHDTAGYYAAEGGVVETWNLSNCSQFPVTGVFFYNISAEDRNGIVTPNWMDTVYAGVYPFCSFSVTSTPTTVNLYHNIQALSNSIRQHDGYWFTPVAVGGFPPYSSYWEVCLIDCSGGGDRAPVARGGVAPNLPAHGWQFYSTNWTIYFPNPYDWVRSTVTDSHNQQAVATYYIPS